MSADTKRIVWIDFAKVIAITAVLTDHFYTVTYKNDLFYIASMCSITMFIFLSGITSFKSFERNNDVSLNKTMLRHFISVFMPYLLAVALYRLICERSFVFSDWIYDSLHFGQAGGFYFIPVYLELVLLSPFLYRIVKRCSKSSCSAGCYLIAASLAYIAGFYLKKVTIMFDLYGAGAYLFGGSFLFVYVLGMIFTGINFSFKSFKASLMGSIFSVLLWIITLRYVYLNISAPPEFWIPYTLLSKSPPGIMMIIYGLLTVFGVFSVSSLAEYNKTASKVTGFIAQFGKYTLTIFLYHALCLRIIPKYIPARFSYEIRNFVISILVAFTPVIVKWGYDKFMRWLKDEG